MLMLTFPSSIKIHAVTGVAAAKEDLLRLAILCLQILTKNGGFFVTQRLKEKETVRSVSVVIFRKTSH